MSSWGDFATSLVINTVVASVFLLLFVLLRPHFRQHFAIRNYIFAVDQSKQQQTDHVPPPTMPIEFRGWMRQFSKISEMFVLYSAADGLDSFMFVRLFKLTGTILLLTSLYALPVLLPVNITAEYSNSIDRLSAGNIPQGSHRFWAHLFGQCILVGISIWLLHREYRIFLSRRHDFLRDRYERGSGQTALIRDVPDQLRFSSALDQSLRQVHPVESVTIVREYSQLAQLIEQRDSARDSLARAYAEELETLGARPRHLDGVQTVDSIDFYRQQLKDLEYDIEKLCSGDCDRDDEQQRGFRQVESPQLLHSPPVQPAAGASAEVNPFPSYPAALASFGSVQDTIRFIDQSPAGLTVTRAPLDPRDLDTTVLGATKWQRILRRLLMIAAMFGLMIVWTIPVAFIASLSNLDELEKRVPALAPLVESNAVVKSFLQGFLPSLAMLIFMKILPIILKRMAIFQAIPLKSHQDHSVMTRFFVFLVVNFFLLQIVSSSFLNVISSIITDPASTIRLLAKGLPSVSTLYITFLMLQVWCFFSPNSFFGGVESHQNLFYRRPSLRIHRHCFDLLISFCRSFDAVLQRIDHRNQRCPINRRSITAMKCHNYCISLRSRQRSPSCHRSFCHLLVSTFSSATRSIDIMQCSSSMLRMRLELHGGPKLIIDSSHVSSSLPWLFVHSSRSKTPLLLLASWPSPF